MEIDNFINLVKSKKGCGYVWGAPRVIDKEEVLTEELLDWYKKIYGAEHYIFKTYSAAKWIGKEVFDCSGFVVWALSKLKLINADYTSEALYEKLCRQVSKEDIQPGDLCFRKTSYIEHVAVYLGSKKVVHARSTFYGVVETALFTSFNVFGRLKIFEEGGNDMVDKIKDFQRRYELKVDGIIGPQTKAKAAEVKELCEYILSK